MREYAGAVVTLFDPLVTLDGMVWFGPPRWVTIRAVSHSGQLLSSRLCLTSGNFYFGPLFFSFLSVNLRIA